jgi:chemosensory pili system protein ChpC
MTSHQASQAKVLGIRLPLTDKTVLLPYSMVAEVASLSLRPQSGGCLGLVEWRGVRIPVFSLERGCGTKVEILAGRVRVAVLYGVGNPEKRPYYALVLSGMPRTETIVPAQLAALPADEIQNECRILGTGAVLAEETVYIPHALELEAWLDEAEARADI